MCQIIIITFLYINTCQASRGNYAIQATKNKNRGVGCIFLIFFFKRRLSHKLAWLACNNELLTGLCQLGSILAQLASAYLEKKLIPPDYLGYFLLIL